MRERGYIALLVVVGVVVIAAIFVANINRGDLSRAMAAADSALFRPSSTGRFDSIPYRSKLPRKSRQTLRIELNSADSTTLCRVYGIGPVFSHRIIERRVALGGFYRVEQLGEVRGIDKEAYERIAKNFFVDTTLIIKINVNFATRKMLTSHPYISGSMARRIEQARMKGGYVKYHKELLERNILLPNETLRVAHYLSFDTVKKS